MLGPPGRANIATDRGFWAHYSSSVAVLAKVSGSGVNGLLPEDHRPACQALQALSTSVYLLLAVQFQCAVTELSSMPSFIWLSAVSTSACEVGKIT